MWCKVQGGCGERRYFEEVQGKLEVAVEQSSLPLALMPDVQACDPHDLSDTLAGILCPW